MWAVRVAGPKRVSTSTSGSDLVGSLLFLPRNNCQGLGLVSTPDPTETISAAKPIQFQIISPRADLMRAANGAVAPIAKSRSATVTPYLAGISPLK